MSTAPRSLLLPLAALQPAYVPAVHEQACNDGNRGRQITKMAHSKKQQQTKPRLFYFWSIQLNYNDKISRETNSGHVPIQGLHPSKDVAFATFKGNSFAETFTGRVNLVKGMAEPSEYFLVASPGVPSLNLTSQILLPRPTKVKNIWPRAGVLNLLQAAPPQRWCIADGGWSDGLTAVGRTTVQVIDTSAHLTQRPAHFGLIFR